MDPNATDDVAIPSDVTTPNTEDATPETPANPEAPAERPKSRRELAMDGIAAARHADLIKEGVLPAEAPAAVPAPAETPEGDAQLAAQLADGDQPNVIDPAQFAKLKVPVKVDGQDGEVSLDELVRNHQKAAAADKRLQEATELLKQAREQAKPAEPTPPAAEPATPGETPKPPEDRKARLKEAVATLYQGDEDKAVEILDELLGKGVAPAATPPQQPVIDLNAMAAQLEQQIAVRSAYAQAQTDYPELFADTERGAILGQATLQQFERLAAQGVPRAEALGQAAQKVAQMFGVQPAGRPAAPSSTTARDDRLDKKAALDPVRTAHVAAVPPAPAIENANPSATIAEMAARRGPGRHLGR